jgi:RNA polymerase sigma-70 factor, ECF subfamily
LLATVEGVQKQWLAFDHSPPLLCAGMLRSLRAFCTSRELKLFSLASSRNSFIGAESVVCCVEFRRWRRRTGYSPDRATNSKVWFFLKKDRREVEMSSSNRPVNPEQLRHLADEPLCREVAAGNEQAFLELFDRYWRQVFRMALSVIRDQAEAEDLAQTLFLEVHTSMLRFDEQRGSFRTLLLRYAYTRAVDHRRRLESRRFYTSVQFEELDPSTLARDASFGLGLSAEEGTRLIEQAMKHLDENQHATVKAYFYRGLSINEIADELGDSFGNVRHYLYRGLEKMRKLLVTEDGTENPERREPGVASRGQRRVSKRLASEVSVVRARSI